MKKMLINTKSSKMKEPHKLVLNAVLVSDLHAFIGLENLSIYYTWKIIRQQYTSNKLKIIAPTWNEEFDLLCGSYSVSDITSSTYLKVISSRP